MKTILALFVALLMALMLPANASGSRYLDGQFITNGPDTVTVPNATGTMVLQNAAQALSNKDLEDTSTTIYSSTDDTRLIKFSVGGTTGKRTFIDTAPTLDRTLTVPDATGTIALTSDITASNVTLGTANGLSLIGQQLSLGTSTASTTGALTSTDWSTFNGKQNALGFTAVPDTRTVNGHALSANVTVTKSDVGLGNVTNDAQVKKSDYTAKADIIVGTGAGTYTTSLTGSGNNGYLLTLDSGETSGVKWAAAPAVAPSIVGTRASPTAIAAVTGISFSGLAYSNINFIAGLAGPVTVTANPRIAAATNVGQKLQLIGRDATNTVTLSDGNGLSLNGVWVGGLDSVLELVWDGSFWVETARR